MRNMPKPKCFCEDYMFDTDTRLYYMISLDNVSGFADGKALIEMPARFCPVCGKELPKGDSWNES